MQGVHPREKVTPTIKEPNRLEGFFETLIIFSWLRKGILRRPSMLRPMMMSTAPPTIMIHFWDEEKRLPRKEDERPRAMNTKEKPMMKESEWESTLFLDPLSERSLKSCTVTPHM